jgi:Sec-independent protein translocase protein TatA
MAVANIFGPDLGIVVLVIVAVLLFGSQAPKIARNLGLAGKEFRKAQEEAEREHAAKAQEDAAKAAMPPPAIPAPATPGDDRINLTRAELDALLAAREAETKAKETSQGN